MKKNFARNLLFNNFRLKAFSLGISIVLYLFIAYEADTSIELEVPLKLVTDQDIVVVSDIPPFLKVTYRGPWASFRSIEGNVTEPFTLELKDHSPGPIALRIQPEILPRIAGMQAVKIQPSILNVRLDRQIERLVPIRADVRGKPAHGYTLGEIILKPRKMLIKGPASELDQVNYLMSKPVDITDATKDVTREIGVRTPAHPLELKDNIKEVNITVVVEEELIERHIKSIAVILKDRYPGLRLKSKSVAVSLRGPVLIMESLDPKLIKAEISLEDINTLSSGILELVPELTGLPEGVFAIGHTPTVNAEYRPRRIRKRNRR